MSIVHSFEISFDSSDDSYKEGDLLTGKLVIGILGKVKYRAVKLELYGVALVQWDGGGDINTTCTTSSTTTGNSVHGQQASNTTTAKQAVNMDPYAVNKSCNREQYFRTTLTLLDKDNLPAHCDQTIFDEAEYVVPFAYQLPRDLPTSFEGKFGQIRYVAKATIERQLVSACGDTLRKDIITKRAFTIVNGLDLNFIQEAASKIRIVKHKKIGAVYCFGGGSIDIEFNVSRSGYVPGEAIQITTLVKNRSRISLLYCKAALRMIVNYNSTRRRRKEMRTLEVVKQVETPPGKEKRRISRLFIPPLPPTGISRSRLIDITYDLRLSCMLEGATDPIVFTKDIYIGTVPINRSHMKSCLSAMANMDIRQMQYHRVVTSSRQDLSQISADTTSAQVAGNSDTSVPAPEPSTTSAQLRQPLLIQHNPSSFCSSSSLSSTARATFNGCCGRTANKGHHPSCSSLDKKRCGSIGLSNSSATMSTTASSSISATATSKSGLDSRERQIYRRPARDFDTESYQSIYPQQSCHDYTTTNANTIDTNTNTNTIHTNTNINTVTNTNINTTDTNPITNTNTE